MSCGSDKQIFVATLCAVVLIFYFVTLYFPKCKVITPRHEPVNCNTLVIQQPEPANCSDHPIQRCEPVNCSTHLSERDNVTAVDTLQSKHDKMTANSVVSEDPEADSTAASFKKWNVFDGRSVKYTVIMLTYNRMDFLKKLLKHYSSFPEVDQVLVVWNNVGVPPPTNITNELEPHSATVRFLVQKENNIRNRMQPFPEIKTKAVYLADDDLFITEFDLKYAFHTWKDFPQRIVGFVPRAYSALSAGRYKYVIPPFSEGTLTYAMVLTGAGFVHRNYLKMFNESAPRQVHKLIDDLQNCEDMAMNWMVANFLFQLGMPQPSGLFIKPKTVINYMAWSSKAGLSFKKNHSSDRSKCIAELIKIYHGFKPPHTNVVTAPVH